MTAGRRKPKTDSNCDRQRENQRISMITDLETDRESDRGKDSARATCREGELEPTSRARESDRDIQRQTGTERVQRARANSSR